MLERHLGGSGRRRRATGGPPVATCLYLFFRAVPPVDSTRRELIPRPDPFSELFSLRRADPALAGVLPTARRRSATPRVYSASRRELGDDE